MKNKIVISFFAALISISNASFAAGNLPHQNRSDVDSTVKLFVPYNQFSIINDASLGAGAPVVAQINSLNISGVQMEAVGDDVHVLMPIPDNMCIDCPSKISVLWTTGASTTTQTATWKVLYDAKAAGETLGVASTALNTAIASDAVENVAYDLNETSQGIIDASVLGRSDTLHILVELDAVSGLNPAVSPTFLAGMYFEYTREQL